MQPVRRPAACARVRPWPSCASNVLISRAVPSFCESRVTPPSVSVPSTSMRSNLICAARFLSAAVSLGKSTNQASKRLRKSLGQGSVYRTPKHRRGREPRVGVVTKLQRSEEHTSELQSPMYLVCRLLLEKKKK